MDYIHSKSLADGGEKCSKPDLSVTVEFKNKSKKKFYISLKSTFVSTQLSVHSISSFKKHLDDKGISVSKNAENFLRFFTCSDYLR